MFMGFQTFPEAHWETGNMGLISEAGKQQHIQLFKANKMQVITSDTNRPDPQDSEELFSIWKKLMRWQ